MGPSKGLLEEKRHNHLHDFKYNFMALQRGGVTPSRHSALMDGSKGGMVEIHESETTAGKRLMVDAAISHLLLP